MSTTKHKIETAELNTDVETRSLDAQCVNNMEEKQPSWHLVKYMLMGMLFGIILVKSEVLSWFRIQEMFRLHSFHMYGVIGTAAVVGMISVFLIKKWGIKSLSGEKITIAPKKFTKGQVYGGLIFGLGWALTGACPGPLFAQMGSGFAVVGVTFLSAVAGTWVYGYFRDKLPN